MIDICKRWEQPECVLDGRRYRLLLSFDRVLLFYRLIRDPDVEETDKLRLAIQLLVSGRRAGRLTPEAQKRLLNQISAAHLQPARKSAGKSKPVMDFEEDADLIYSSFRLAYGIDLNREVGRLPFTAFIALLEGLPEQTKLREVMSIRSAKMPKPDKHNAEQRKALMQAKQYYALKSARMGYSDGLELLFAIAKAQAERG